VGRGMKGIDTNVLVRYIIQDDAKQSKMATDFIERKCSENSSLFINGIVLCELVWVLESAYEYSRENIVKVIEQILKTRQFLLDEPDILWQSLRGYKNEGADFADNYIAHLNKHKGCEYTVTFDKRAAKLNHFNLL
jgi:predicted nucleic-acid-binding protein